MLVGVNTGTGWLQVSRCFLQRVPFPQKNIKVTLSEQKTSTFNREAGQPACLWLYPEGMWRIASGFVPSAGPHAPGMAGAAACAAGEGDFKAEVLLLKLSEAVGWARGICWQVGLFFCYHWREFLRVQKLEGREGGRGKKEFCPTRLQQLSLSAQLQSFSSPASPVRSGNWSTRILSQSPKTSGIKHLGAVQRLDPRLRAGSCEQRGDGSLATPAAPRLAALGLGHPVPVLLLICSALSFLLQLIFS